MSPTPRSDLAKLFSRTSLAASLGMMLAFGASGCIEDPDCGICDPDKLVLTSITGVNYAGDPRVHIVSPECEGEGCPEPFSEARYFIDRIGPCEETEDAQEDPFGAEEYCKLSPLVTSFGIKFVFNNLLDATTIEHVRKNPSNPQLIQVYQWKPEVLNLEGPISRYNGDFFTGGSEQPDTITRYVNLSCIDNLRLRAENGQGEPFGGHEEYEDPETNRCNTLIDGKPAKMWAVSDPPDGFPAAVTTSYKGEWDWRGGSCSPPQEGVDTCCTVCDYELSVNVAKYGVPPGAGEDATRSDWLNPHVAEGEAGAALRCDPDGDKFQQCADFQPWVDRSEEYRFYTYPWTSENARDVFPIPYYDKLRETHPSARPTWLEDPETAPRCGNTNDCTSDTGHNLPGTECVGQDPDGNACNPAVGDDCTEGRCLARWFVSCNASPDTTGGQGYCVDSRFSDAGAKSCYRATSAFERCVDGACSSVRARKRLANCDGDENGLLTGEECCQDSLGDQGETCDPVFQEEVEPIARYDRDNNLPDVTRVCVCVDNPDQRYAPNEEGEKHPCHDVVVDLCFDDEGNFIEERRGEYAQSFVARQGGVIYDPAIKGFEWRPAHIGRVPRATVESCWEPRVASPVGSLNTDDGWRMHDPLAPHNYEDFDRALCSGQEYTVVFNTDSDEGTVLADKVGNTLEGKARYTFETPQFHVIPDSGFPRNSMQIGACDSFSLRFSNKFDMSQENLAKLQIWSLDELAESTPDERQFELGELVAGGLDCVETETEAEDTGNPPCLTIDVDDQWRGIVEVEIDPVEFGAELEPGAWYRLVVPGLESIDEMNDPAKYFEAFWDVCGMPLISGNPDEPGQVESTHYDFQIDPPQCKEDKDRDGIPFSCDNAQDHRNPEQGNMDNDMFGDVIDKCPTLFNTNNKGDSDNDGVGNDCDNCRRVDSAYNSDADDLAIPFYMRVRNVPFQSDADQDGIGDVCDNCVVVANCQDYGPDMPWELGEPIAHDDPNVCQRDDNSDMIGDECEQFTDPEGDFATEFAAGPIGFEADDDFDQDGLRNMVDACPRQPVEHQTCATADECRGSAECTEGVCNHPDEDGDGVGDVCDTCPFAVNPGQVVDGQAQEDDEDNDFIGKACEAGASCAGDRDSRPLGFYEVAVNGYCCVRTYPAGDACSEDRDCDTGQICDEGTCALVDPDGLPIRLECTDAQQDAGECRKLPADVQARPGVTQLPAGCEQALADAGMTEEENVLLGPEDYQLDELWGKLCFLPQWDQDFDGLGDVCDLCPFAFDPTNAPYRDDFGRVHPKNGKFCTEEYSIENQCDLGDGGMGTGDMGTGTGTGDMGTGTGS